MTLEDLYFQIAIAAVGIIATIIVAIMYREYKEIKYFKENVELVPNNTVVSSNLVFLNDNTPIRNVSLLRVTFWNSGKKGLTDSDFLPKSQLKLTAMKNCEILACDIDEITKLDNNIVISQIKRKKEYSINFSYLSPKDGCVISIIHTGTSEKDIEFSGIVEGSGPIKLRGTESIWKNMVKESIVGIGLGLTTVAIFLISLPTILEFAIKNLFNTETCQVVLLIMVFMSIILIVMLSLVFIYRRSYDYLTLPPRFFKKIRR